MNKSEAMKAFDNWMIETKRAIKGKVIHNPEDVAVWSAAWGNATELCKAELLKERGLNAMLLDALAAIANFTDDAMARNTASNAIKEAEALCITLQ